MNIKYPWIVEKAYPEVKKVLPKITKSELYKELIELDYIDQDGNATQWAIDNGYVADDHSIEAEVENFKHQCPAFRNVSLNHFKFDDQGDICVDAVSTYKVFKYQLEHNQLNNSQVEYVTKFIEKYEKSKGGK